MGTIHIEACFRCGLLKYYTLAEICRNGDEEPPCQACLKHQGRCHKNSATSQPVHMHGGDVGQRCWCSAVFERWMKWQPEEQAWNSYINLELRYKVVDWARTIYECFVLVDPAMKNWFKYSRFEEKHASIAHERIVYERGMEVWGMSIWTNTSMWPLLNLRKIRKNLKGYKLSTDMPWIGFPNRRPKNS